MSASENLGNHLLGWKPAEKDERDYKMADYLRVDATAQDFTAIDNAVRALDTQPGAAATTKAVVHAIVDFLKGGTPTPTPTPTPVPTVTSKDWADLRQLDQGQTGHCVGFGGAQFHNCEPYPGVYVNDDGHKLYYECKILDGEPKAENGSSVHSLAKALKNRGLISTYVWAASTDDIKAWVLNKGPVVVGTDWYNDMFNPDANGFVTPTGSLAGGHCFLLRGYNSTEDAFHFQNSWGSSWGLGGYFKIKVSDFKKLLAADGEAMASLEQAV